MAEKKVRSQAEKVASAQKDKASKKNKQYNFKNFLFLLFCYLD